jgi:hyperosmotically inducible protein
MHRVLMTLTLGCALATCSTSMGFAQEPDSSTKPDNTKVNKRDRQADEPTADQQKENASDRDMAKNVRRAIVKDKSLSSYAHNVKVIVQSGSVTLKGPVRSAEESKEVEAKATEIAGAGKVKNELSVKDETQSRKH